MTNIKYLGQIIEENGRKSDLIRASLIKICPQQMCYLYQAFFRFSNYCKVFIPVINFLRAPLKVLLKTDSKWNWTTECQKVFEKNKKILPSYLFLSDFDPKLEIIVTTYTSHYGIIAVILQDGSVKAK